MIDAVILLDLQDVLNSIKDTWVTPLILFALVIWVVKKFFFSSEPPGLSSLIPWAIALVIGFALYFSPEILSAFGQNVGDQAGETVDGNW